MDSLADVMAEIMGAPKMSREERLKRTRLLAALFRCFNEPDQQKVEGYVAATAEIPLDKLASAVGAVIRSHVYTTVPTLAELHQAAREAAGMHREQYHAGRYLPPPRDWPPVGKRHAIHAGQLERMPSAAAQLPAGSPGQLEAGD